jgi:hypothetical protein
MLRKFVFSLLAFGVVTVGLLADEFRGKVKSVDADKMTITVAGKDGEKTFTVDKDTKFVKAGKGKGSDPPSRRTEGQALHSRYASWRDDHLRNEGRQGRGQRGQGWRHAQKEGRQVIELRLLFSTARVFRRGPLAFLERDFLIDTLVHSVYL